jgi:hypothetical protein
LDLLFLKKARIATDLFAFTRQDLLINEQTEEITPGHFRHQADLPFAQELRTSSILFPNFTWPRMSKKDRDALRQFYLNLLVHELGHFVVAGQVLAYAKRSFTGFGTTPNQAEHDTRGQIDVATLHNDVDRISDEYDLHTSHGAEQSEGTEQHVQYRGQE